MGRVENHVQEVLVARGATDVLRRAVALTGQADRLEDDGFFTQDLLDQNGVPPVCRQLSPNYPLCSAKTPSQPRESSCNVS
jgi:hypothetical protein